MQKKTPDTNPLQAGDKQAVIVDAHGQDPMLRDLFIQAPVGITVLNEHEYRVELANQYYLELVDRKEEDFVGKPLFESLPEVKDAVEPLLDNVLQTGQPYFGDEFQIQLNRFGREETSYFTFVYQPRFDATGRINGVIVIANEVTNQVRAKHSIAESERAFRKMVTESPIAMTIWRGPDHTIEMANDAMFKNIWRKKPEDVLGKKALEVFPELLRQKYPELLREVYETGNAHREEESLAYVAGEDGMKKFYLDFEYAPLFETDGTVSGIMITVNDVTDRVEARHKVEDAEARLRLAAEGTGLATWDLDLQTREIIYSPRLNEIFGWPADKLLTHAEMRQQIHPDDIHPIVEEAFRIALKTGIYDYEARVVLPTKKFCWIRTQGRVNFDEDGKPLRMLGTMRDITDHKNSIQNISESEERFKTIANTAPVMIWMSGNDKFSDFFNKSWLNFTGRKIEEEIGDGWLDNVHADDKQLCLEVYNHSHSQHKPFYIEYRLKRKDGKYRWIADNAVPRYDAAGNFIGFISACMDIDDEKRFNQRLQASELLFKTISNVSPVALWMTNEQHQTTFVNDTWTRWTGKGLGAAGAGWIDSVVEEDKVSIVNLFRSTSVRFEPFVGEFRFYKTDGTVHWGLSEGFPYYDGEGNFAGYAGSVTDITERKEDELRKNEFLAVASHELKTPITSIKAYTQLLANTYDKTNDAFLKNALSKVENQVNKMSKLVSDFLNLSKIESDRFQLMRERFTINELVREIVSDTQLVTTSHVISIRENVEALVLADKEKISQVLANLLNNAIKYSPAEPEILVTIEPEDDHVTVTIHDKGIGVRAEEHDKIFQRFYRAGSNNIHFSGFGIGLYISAEIIRQHSGKIGVLEQEEKGSRFYFKLALAN